MKILQVGALKLGIDLTAGQLSAFETYYAELVAWNKVHHLTAITSYQGVQVKHFLDSLTCVQGLVPPAPSVPTLRPQFPPWRVLDVGSGAGFPGLPLKICFPQFRLTLLESTGKKTAFLNHVVQRLGLTEVSVVTGRAEELAHRSAFREAFDVVLARAVAELAVLAEFCLPFCAVGGTFIAQKKAGIDDEIRAALAALAALGGFLRGQIPVVLPGTEPRQLVVVDKVKATPDLYPRRTGVPAKKPLK